MMMRTLMSGGRATRGCQWKRRRQFKWRPSQPRARQAKKSTSSKVRRFEFQLALVWRAHLFGWWPEFLQNVYLATKSEQFERASRNRSRIFKWAPFQERLERARARAKKQKSGATKSAAICHPSWLGAELICLLASATSSPLIGAAARGQRVAIN